MEKEGKDVESGRPARIPHLKMLVDQKVVTPEIENWKYKGSGTEEDPYLVTWIDDDPRNPMLFSEAKKWIFTVAVALSTLTVSFVSSAYSGGEVQIIEEFGCSQEVATLGIALFVLGFAIGPLLWAPLSELFGRQLLFVGSFAGFTCFNVGACGAQNIQTLVILRFFSGCFGSSPLTNAGGVIADMFPANQRGIAMSVFAAAPFMGPVLGPIVGGFVAETVGWRWNMGVMAAFGGVLWIIGSFIVVETYAPLLFRKRATKLSEMTGKVYMSTLEADQGKVSPKQAFKTALTRPWMLLFREPIVMLFTIYLAIVYGTLYMLFGAFPIVFQQTRGWSQGIGGLAFLGVMVGMIIALCYAAWDNKNYIKTAEKSPGGIAPPEARLPVAMIGSVAIPIGLIVFAWTDGPDIHWIVSIIFGAPFGFGMVLIFLSVFNYLIDAYVIFAASVLAANSVLRSIFGAVFPLFTSYMYDGLGIHWATMVPAFLALACVPFPFLFYKYGPAIRKRCKYSAQAEEFLQKMRNDAGKEQTDEKSSDDAASTPSKEFEGDEDQLARGDSKDSGEEHEAFEPPAEDEHRDGSRFERIRATGQPISRMQSNRSVRSYEPGPFDIDRVNTRESFPSESRASRSASRVTSRVASRTASQNASPTRSTKSSKSGKK